MAPNLSNVYSLAREGQQNLVLAALRAEPSLIFATDPDKRTVLQNAVMGGPEVVEAVLEFLERETAMEEAKKKEVLENKDEAGGTALISASAIGNLQVVKALLTAGASVHTTNDRGLTPLHYAASKGHASTGAMLISNGADINVRDRANQLPLHRATSTGSVPFVRLILASESPNRPNAPRLNQQDRAGNTPLHLAIESGHGEVAAVLIEGGADRHRTDQEGRRAEETEGVGGMEGKRVREYIVQRCGPLDED